MYHFNNNRLAHSNIIQFVLSLFFILLLCSNASAIDYTLQWDANPEPDIAGYKVYYKANSSGQPAGDYDEVIDVGNVTTKKIEGLDEGVNYYFAVTAYDTSGLESDFSNEVSNGAEIILPDEGSTPYLMTQGNDPDSLALRVEGGDILEGFNWGLTSGSVGSLGEVTNERTVIYSAPSSIEGESAAVTITLRNNAGTFLGQQVITVYKAVTITNKLASDQTINIGESTEPFTVQGGNGSYTWTVRRDGDLVEVYSGASYVFNVPSNGVAGIYTITVTDGNNFTDSFDVDVLDNISSSSGDSTENEDQDVSGYIVDGDGNGIGDADVMLLSPGQYIDSTVTDSDGFFTLPDLPVANKYHFMVSKNGYLSTEFTSQDLLENIVLENADTYIGGEITVDGAAFSGEPVEVTVSYIINDVGLLAGKAISTNGEFRIDFEEVLGVSDYILTAARPGEYGHAVVSALPQNGVIIDIDTTLVGDNVNALAGGSSTPVTIAGQSVSIIKVPFGGVDPSSGVTDIDVDITTFTNPNSVYTSGSGNLIYDIDMEYNDITTILTLPFDLAQVAPGDFENGNAVIFHADTIDELVSGTNLKEVLAYDIISVDYIGDGSTGLVEFYADSLSVFGVSSTSSVGSISTQTPSGGSSGGGSCFIDTIVFSVGSTAGFQRMLVLFGVIVLIGFAIARNQLPSFKASVFAKELRPDKMMGQGDLMPEAEIINLINICHEGTKTHRKAKNCNCEIKTLYVT